MPKTNRVKLVLMIHQTELLQFALIGYESRAAEIRAMLTKQATPAAAPAKEAPTEAPKRRLSAQGLRNIRAALKKRWAAKRAGKPVAAKTVAPAKKKRTLSPAQLAAMRQNAAKARAAAKKKAAA